MSDMKDEEKASGIDTEMSESETALEEIIVKEDASQQSRDCHSDGNRKTKEQEQKRNCPGHEKESDGQDGANAEETSRRPGK